MEWEAADDKQLSSFDTKCENLVMELEKKITTEIILNETAEKKDNEAMVVDSLKLNLMKLDDEFSSQSENQLNNSR